MAWIHLPPPPAAAPPPTALLCSAPLPALGLGHALCMTWLAYLWRHQVGLWPWTFSSVGVVKGRSVCHWFIGFQFPKQKSCWEFKSVCDCVQRGETHGLEDRLVRAEISFKVVLLNLAYITGILTHDMCGSSSGACHRKVCSKCRNLSHRIWVKFAPNAVAYSCIIKQVTSFYTQVTKGIKKME